jgi:hypothetical protein
MEAVESYVQSTRRDSFSTPLRGKLSPDQVPRQQTSYCGTSRRLKAASRQVLPIFLKLSPILTDTAILFGYSGDQSGKTMRDLLLHTINHGISAESLRDGIKLSLLDLCYDYLQYCLRETAQFCLLHSWTALEDLKTAEAIMWIHDNNDLNNKQLMYCTRWRASHNISPIKRFSRRICRQRGRQRYGTTSFSSGKGKRSLQMCVTACKSCRTGVPFMKLDKDSCRLIQ